MKTQKEWKGLHCVYAIVHYPTQQRYIGATRNLQTRISVHRCNLKRGNMSARHMHELWIRDGEDAFGVEILETFAPGSDELFEREQYWLDKRYLEKHSLEFNLTGRSSMIRIGVSSDTLPSLEEFARAAPDELFLRKGRASLLNLIIYTKELEHKLYGR